jgi:hypothetical protein
MSRRLTVFIGTVFIGTAFIGIAFMGRVFIDTAVFSTRLCSSTRWPRHSFSRHSLQTPAGSAGRKPTRDGVIASRMPRWSKWSTPLATPSNAASRRLRGRERAAHRKF